ncbi:MAG TPA: hypothetical protein V6C95_10700 [Coleofasciculaceae cyanobacterium]
MFELQKNEHKFVKIVYAKVKKNGKEELIAFKLYADGLLELNQ